MLRLIPRGPRSNSPSVVRTLLQSRSIPSHSPDDVVAILANIGTLDDDFSKYLHERIYGMNSMQAFQLLTILHRSTGFHAIVDKFDFRVLVDSLCTDVLGSGMVVSDTVHALEYLAALQGSNWEPDYVLKHRTRIVDWIQESASVDETIRLAKIGISSMEAVRTAITRSTNSGRDLSDSQKCKLALYSGLYDFLPDPNQPIPTTCLPDLLGAYASGDSANHSNLELVLSMLPASIHQLSPQACQQLLWSLTALGVSRDLWETILTICSRKPWVYTYMREQTLMAMHPTHEPSYPVRFPIWGAQKVCKALDRLDSGLISLYGKDHVQRDVVIRDRYWMDIRIRNDIFLSIVPYFTDPMYRIYRRHLQNLLPLAHFEVYPDDSVETIHARLDSDKMSLEESRTKLHALINELTVLVSNTEDRDPLDGDALAAVITLGRRLGNCTVPPLFVAFNTESGPLEAMPQRFRVPFPTADNFRASVLQRQISLQLQSPPEEEYADDF